MLSPSNEIPWYHYGDILVKLHDQCDLVCKFHRAGSRETVTGGVAMCIYFARVPVTSAMALFLDVMFTVHQGSDLVCVIL